MKNTAVGAFEPSEMKDTYVAVGFDGFPAFGVSDF